MINSIQNDFSNKNNQFKQNKNQPNFKGGLLNNVGDASSWGIKKIENGGVLVDFLFVDMLGMVIPRTYQAYQRNKEELGHLNYKSGTEELIREIFSGPSMFVIPILFIKAADKLLGKASNIQFKALDSLTDSFGRVVEKGIQSKDKTQIQKDFYSNIFKEAFEKHREVRTDKNINIDAQVEKITEHLHQAAQGNDKSKNIAAVKQIVSDVNKAHGIHLDNSHNVTLKDGLVKEVGALSDDIIKYSHDIVGKIADDAPKSTTKFLQERLSGIHKNKTLGRRGMLAATFLSTVSFLYAIPIMYKRNRQFPGIEGLTPETQAKKGRQPIFKKVETKETDIPKSNFSGKKNDEKDNNNVSFGSSAQSSVDKFFKKFDFNGHSVPHAVLGIYTLGIMLGARLFQARNADERREVATRDFSGLSTITFALPIVRNFISSGIKLASGIPIAKPLKATQHFNPTKKPFTFENIEDIYSGPSKLKNGLADFAQNISEQGGDLRKVFNFLGDDSKKALNKIAETVSQNNTEVEAGNIITRAFQAGKNKLYLPTTNEKIVELFKKAQQNQALKSHLEVIKKELDNPKNSIVKFAEAGKSIPEVASIIGISAFLGWFLPWFNINYTKKLYKEKNAANLQNKWAAVAA